MPSKSLSPQSCVRFVIKSHWPPKSNSLGVLSPFVGSPGWEICCGSSNFCNNARTSLLSLFSSLCHLLGHSIVKLMVTSSERTYATCHAFQVRCSQSSCPLGRSLLTRASAGDTQTLKGRSGSVSCGSHCFFPFIQVHTNFCLCPPSISGGSEI